MLIYCNISSLKGGRPKYDFVTEYLDIGTFNIHGWRGVIAF